ncbi:hypothetical protein BDV96DRAFT_595112 [Lophiotrema nucula]|uniref:Uncharacterized protein n=1 Tax=Lophiotrema nucula TaxID=690887 RepID=A0A6A5ZM59_9PLEO|nr:hypothetical protein BDV96DRAFT_595112 [Lophiotrema nucula]
MMQLFTIALFLSFIFNLSVTAIPQAVADFPSPPANETYIKSLKPKAQALHKGLEKAIETSTTIEPRCGWATFDAAPTQFLVATNSSSSCEGFELPVTTFFVGENCTCYWYDETNPPCKQDPPKSSLLGPNDGGFSESTLIFKSGATPRIAFSMVKQ